MIELLPNEALSRVTLANVRELNDLIFTPEEQLFAARISSTLAKAVPLDGLRDVIERKGEVHKGSSDVGDVSWVVPTTGFRTVCWVPGTPPHSWQATAAGGTAIGRKGMLLAAKILAATAYDLYTKPDVVAAAKEEHCAARRQGRISIAARTGTETAARLSPGAGRAKPCGVAFRSLGDVERFMRFASTEGCPNPTLFSDSEKTTLFLTQRLRVRKSRSDGTGRLVSRSTLIWLPPLASRTRPDDARRRKWKPNSSPLALRGIAVRVDYRPLILRVALN